MACGFGPKSLHLHLHFHGSFLLRSGRVSRYSFTSMRAIIHAEPKDVPAMAHRSGCQSNTPATRMLIAVSAHIFSTYSISQPPYLLSVMLPILRCGSPSWIEAGNALPETLVPRRMIGKYPPNTHSEIRLCKCPSWFHPTVDHTQSLQFFIGCAQLVTHSKRVSLRLSFPQQALPIARDTIEFSHRTLHLLALL